MEENSNIFSAEGMRFDAWFDSPEGKVLFENELAAIRLLWSEEFRPALEVGVGTGRFAQALGVEFGIDPAAGALRLAEGRGIKVTQASGEALPFPDEFFGCVLLIVALCFSENPNGLLQESSRVLRPGGWLLIGDIPRESAWGRWYEHRGLEGHPFYGNARFRSVAELVTHVSAASLSLAGFSSTLCQSQPGSPRPEPPRSGLAVDAGFVCLLAQKGCPPNQPASMHVVA